jgi:hypothetical protein
MWLYLKTTNKNVAKGNKKKLWISGEGHYISNLEELVYFKHINSL